MIDDFRGEVALSLADALAELENASSSAEVRAAIARFTGRKGRIKALRERIGKLPSDQRPPAGQVLDAAASQFTGFAAAAAAGVGSDAGALNERFDATVPGIDYLGGGLHPIIQMMYDLNDAFGRLNFDIYSGPEISSELYEFDFMNFPPDHPARESMDTYWLATRRSDLSHDRLCLRPHLTGASVRYMRQNRPPFRVVYPGRVYRNESTDARHERAFFQYEALIVDRDIAFSAGTLLTSTVLDTVFGRPVPTRMRTGFFPFVEPGFEIDMQCQVCDGKGCSVCGRVGWLEIMPGGVPHPNVLRAAGLDPNVWTGFYLNVGLDRLVMMRYGIDDVRLFNGGNLQFLGQFR